MLVNRIKRFFEEENDSNVGIKPPVLTDLVEIYWNAKADKYIVTGSFNPPFFHGMGVRKAVPIGLCFNIESVDIPYEQLNRKASEYWKYRPNAYEVTIKPFKDGISLFEYKLFKIEV